MSDDEGKNVPTVRPPPGSTSEDIYSSETVVGRVPSDIMALIASRDADIESVKMPPAAKVPQTAPTANQVAMPTPLNAFAIVELDEGWGGEAEGPAKVEAKAAEPAEKKPVPRPVTQPLAVQKISGHELAATPASGSHAAAPPAAPISQRSLTAPIAFAPLTPAALSPSASSPAAHVQESAVAPSAPISQPTGVASAVAPPAPTSQPTPLAPPENHTHDTSLAPTSQRDPFPQKLLTPGAIAPETPEHVKPTRRSGPLVLALLLVLGLLALYVVVLASRYYGK